MNAKKTLIALATALALAAPLGAGAQLVTLDPTNLVQNIVQVQQAIKQMEALKRQIEQAEDQAKSFSGARGMGNLKTDLKRDYIPKNWKETLSAAEQGSEYANRLKAIRQMAGDIGKIDLATMPESVLKAAERSADREVRAQASANAVYDRANERFDEIGKLGARIETAQDPKAIQDLTARIGIEVANLNNELVRLVSQGQAIDAERNMERQRVNHDYRKALNGL
ncbi:type IV secretion system protein VirB5 [Stenotrophomonas sp. PvP093]|uniref:type IV secretion system protein n=1 Tax=unclassified Stenotrophomonas TaxID=196198 RepID=UPI001AE8AECB|nr:type IV secretion system protein [Stenotrophomonas sp. PvP093]MBP2480140.1 type IV secretion system protein VirB5 [Stenotrophomonas sp. PvP093]